MFDRRGIRFVLVCAAFLALTAHAAFELPQPVSPGSFQIETAVGQVCPTFSWTAARGAKGYELLMRRLTFDGVPRTRRAGTQVLIPGTATTWTPSLQECLQPGESYSWVVREADPDGAYRGAWSESMLFSIRPEPAPAANAADATAGANGNGKGGIPAVLDQLALMQQQMLAMQEQIAANQRATEARFDLVEETQAEHSGVLSRVRTYRPDEEKGILDRDALLFVQSELCFHVEGGVDIESTAQLKGLISLLGELGIDVYGPEAGGKGEGRANASAGIKAVGETKLTFEVCASGPGLRFIDLNKRGVDDPQMLLSRGLADGEDVLSDLLATEAQALGVDLENMGSKLDDGVQALKALRLPDNPFELFDADSPTRQNLAQLAALIPLPPEVRDSLQDLQKVAPSSLEELNVCSNSFRFPLPAGMGMAGLVDSTCEFGNRALELVGLQKGATLEDLAENGLDRIEDLINLRDQLVSVLDTIGSIAEAVDAVSDPRDSISDRICNSLPPRARPPFCP